MIELFDELFNIKENHKFRKFMRYRFYGNVLPEDEVIEMFMDCDAIPNGNIFCDEDKIYYPYIALQRKLIFEHKKYKNQVKSRGISYRIDWENAKSLKRSMDAIVDGLMKSKKDYVAASTREKERKKNAAKTRARKAKERAIMVGSEGEEDFDIDDDDREQEAIDQELALQLQQQRQNTNHNPLPMVCSLT